MFGTYGSIGSNTLNTVCNGQYFSSKCSHLCLVRQSDRAALDKESEATYSICLQSYSYNYQLLNGDIVPPLKIHQTCLRGELPLMHDLIVIVQNGPAWITTPDRWSSFDQPTLPPLLVAAAVASEFVPAEPDTPTVGLHCIISLDRFSTLSKLLRVIAYVFRFIDNTRSQPEERCYGPICAAEFKEAKSKWVKDVQQDVYKKEIANLKLIARQPKVTRTLLVRQLRLFLDDQKFLQCGRRMHNTPVNEMTKFPYLLPLRHWFTRLVILDIHVTLHHSGT